MTLPLAAVVALSACTGQPALEDVPFRPDQGILDVLPKPGAGVAEDRRRVYQGQVAARANLPGGSGNKFARTVRGGSSGEPGSFDYGEGDELWFGVALYLPDGFYDAVGSYFSPLRWDNFGVQNVSRSGLAMHGDRRFRLFRERDGVEDQVNLLDETTVRLEEGRWYWLEVHQRLSTTDGEALNELFVDGRKVGSSTARNYYGEPVSAVRYGIVAISASDQDEPLSLWYDRPTLGPDEAGP